MSTLTTVALLALEGRLVMFDEEYLLASRSDVVSFVLADMLSNAEVCLVL